MRSRADLESLHRFSSRHRDLLARSSQAGCFHCLAIFDPAEIVDWVDGPASVSGDTREGATALCPRCGIDAVLPSAVVDLDAELLAEMRRHWFARQAPVT
jgi:hypothetical protein